MIRDRLVLGCRDKVARARLFREKERGLKRAVEMLRISEATQEQLRKIADEAKETVNAVKNKANTRPNNTQKQRKQRPKQYEQYSKQKGAKQNQCQYCGGHHGKGKCPAYGQVCHKCGKENHFRPVCQTGVVPGGGVWSDDRYWWFNIWSGQYRNSEAHKSEEILCSTMFQGGDQWYSHWLSAGYRSHMQCDVLPGFVWNQATWTSTNEAKYNQIEILR